jgi:hypothetical protein
MAEVDTGRLNAIRRRVEHVDDAAVEPPLPHDLDSNCLAGDTVLDLDPAPPVSSARGSMAVEVSELERSDSLVLLGRAMARR